MERHPKFMGKTTNTKLIYRLNSIPFKIPAGFFTEADKLMLKFILKFKGLRIAKTILKSEGYIWRTHRSHFEIYYKVAMIKTM